ncbi:MAG: hypothetical protein GY722_13910 [bacterium]|nr:hypothetical protein [bacterium]
MTRRVRTRADSDIAPLVRWTIRYLSVTAGSLILLALTSFTILVKNVWGVLTTDRQWLDPATSDAIQNVFNIAVAGAGLSGALLLVFAWPRRRRHVKRATLYLGVASAVLAISVGVALGPPWTS